MRWRFWDKKEIELPAEFTQLTNQVESIQNQMVEVDQQLQKMARLQYKNGKSLEEKVDVLTKTVKENQEKTPIVNSKVIHRIIGQIDDLDIVCSNLPNESEWAELVKKWTSSLVESLSDLGVHQTLQPGDLFDPSRADAVETISYEEGLTQSLKPFQIAAIYKRDFTDSNQQMLRKAQVVTVREED
jgi:molecular chaperone GrpE (heat shock protein)